jgi:hypothetical protein
MTLAAVSGLIPYSYDEKNFLQEDYFGELKSKIFVFDFGIERSFFVIEFFVIFQMLIVK